MKIIKPVPEEKLLEITLLQMHETIWQTVHDFVSGMAVHVVTNDRLEIQQDDEIETIKAKLTRTLYPTLALSSSCVLCTIYEPQALQQMLQQQIGKCSNCPYFRVTSCRCYGLLGKLQQAFVNFQMADDSSRDCFRKELQERILEIKNWPALNCNELELRTLNFSAKQIDTLRKKVL